MKILLVHWDEQLGRGLRRALQRMGHAVLLATDDAALQEMLKRRPDLILVAPDLIEIEGRQLFHRGVKTPLPLLLPIPTLPAQQTADASPDKDSELVCTQAHLRLANHIIRRIRGLIRKGTTRTKVGELTIHFEQKQATFCGQPLLLTPLQFNLLGVLALQAKRVVSPGELVETVWGYKADDAEARELLKVHIRRLRQKMEAIAPNGRQYIQAVRGFGYRLAPPKPL